MKYTVYLSYKKTHHIGSPSQQLQFPTPVVYYNWHNQPTALAFVEGFIVAFLKLYNLIV
jgi:hypothetical protein